MNPCDAVYRERDQLVAALSKHYQAHLSRHLGDSWEDDWRNIVCIHLPEGQATWHIHDSELPLFRHLRTQPDHWDGHTPEEKYRRLNAVEAPSGRRRPPASRPAGCGDREA
jgi:hypothetical protein